MSVALGVYVIYYVTLDLPDYQRLAEYNPPIVTRLYAADGKLVEEYAKEYRIFVPISSIPKTLINAFLAAEDKNFYAHQGVDPIGIMRAAFHNIIAKPNKSLAGGSTITQQVVKNFLLSNEKSFSRKIKEAILSYRISKAYSKGRILELYLNQIYLGNGSYGVASAALNYFNKSIDELNIEEAAFLAALPKAPSNYDPKRNYDKAKSRRDWVLSRMYEENFATADIITKSKAKPIELKIRSSADIAKAPFFAESVRREIAGKYGSNALYEGGLVVHTSLEPRLQEIAEKSFKAGLINFEKRKSIFYSKIDSINNFDNWPAKLSEIAKKQVEIEPWVVAVIINVEKDKINIGLESGKKAIIPLKEVEWIKNGKNIAENFKPKNVILVEQINKKNEYSYRQIPKVNGALVVMDPETGKVLALVGGFRGGVSEFNRATQAKRQPGSVFKPFVYLAALEAGFTPASIIMDGPVEFSQGPGLPIWRPKNYSGDFLGPTTLRRGVEKSRNTMTVRLGNMVGLNKISEVTKRFGINDNPPNNLAVVLGAAETTLIRMTNAYSMLVNGGNRIYPSLVEKIHDRNGKIIYKRDTRICEDCILSSSLDLFGIMPPEVVSREEKIIDPRVAYQMISILEGVVDRGTAARAKSLGMILGGKTGTSNNSNDVWFIGFSSDMVVGTYIGYDKPQSLGAKETGSSVALPIFIDFMREARKDSKPGPFKVPEGIKFVKINAQTGEQTAEPVSSSVIYEVFKTDNKEFKEGVSKEDESPFKVLEDQESLAPKSNLDSGTGGIY